jgi:RNA polymerase sigma factor (sigma-70 family)
MTATPAWLLYHVRRLAIASAACPAADADLLERFMRHRDETAFAVLVDRHGPMVLRLCRRVLGDADEAEDCFQATFLVLARKAGTIRRRDSLAAWLHGVAYRVARKARAAGARQVGLSPAAHETPADPHPDPLGELSAREVLALVEEEVRRLPQAYQMPVVLCCLEGRTREEAAALLGWTEGSVKGRLERGRALLHARLERRGLTLAAALAAVTASGATAAGVAPGVAAETARAAVAGASARVAALADGALPGGGMARFVCAAILLLVVGVAAGASWLASKPVVPPSGPAQATQPAKGVEQVRASDPLPPGAVARLGSLRFSPGDTVQAVAFSPDRRTLASGNGDQTVRLWEVDTGKEIRVFRGHTSTVLSVAFSPDGKLLASRSGGVTYSDNSIRLWDVATGKEVRRFGAVQEAPWTGSRSYSGSASWAFWIAFSPDGKTLASGAGDLTNRDNVIRLWDIRTGKELRLCRGHREPVRCFAFAPDGKTLASGSADQTVRLWDPVSGKQLHLLRGHQGMVWAVAFSRDGKVLASAGDDRTIRLWDPARGKEQHRFEVPVAAKSVTVIDEGSLAWGDSQGEIHLLDIRTGKEIRRLPGHPYGVSYLCCCPAGKRLASVGEGVDHAVHLWDVRTGKQLSPGPKGHRAPVAAVAFFPDGKTLASAGWDATVRLWQAVTGNELCRLGGAPFRDGTNAVAVSPDGHLLAVATNGGTHIRLLESATGKELQRLTNPGSGWFTAVAFSPDGKTLLTGGNRFRGGWWGTPCLWDVRTGKELRQFQGHQNNARSVAFSPDGKTVVSGGEDSTVRLWETDTGKELRLLRGHQHQVEAVVFSPDGRILASSGAQTIRFWDLETGRELRRLDGQSGITSLAFSPDGGYLASVGHENGHEPVVHLWEAATGKNVRRWSGHRNAINSIAFAPDGRTLATASRDTLVLVWDVTGLLDQGKLVDRRLAGKELEGLWEQLASEDAVLAHRALWRLALAPAQAVPLLKARLRVDSTATARQIDRLIGDLDSDEFTIRERASAELEKIGHQAGPALRKALEGQPGLEVRRRVERLLKRLETKARSSEKLRVVRAVRVLEYSGTLEARRLLAGLAGGAAGTPVTREAKAALQRTLRRGR